MYSTKFIPFMKFLWESALLACEQAPCEGEKNSASEVWIRQRSEWESERESASEACGACAQACALHPSLKHRIMQMKKLILKRVAKSTTDNIWNFLIQNTCFYSACNDSRSCCSNRNRKVENNDNFLSNKLGFGNNDHTMKSCQVQGCDCHVTDPVDQPSCDLVLLLLLYLGI